MKALNLIVPLAAGLAALAPAAALGQGQGPVTIDRLDLGTHVYGDRLGPEDYPGHVVMVFFWDLG